jgi:hypothetical protein
LTLQEKKKELSRSSFCARKLCRVMQASEWTHFCEFLMRFFQLLAKRKNVRKTDQKRVVEFCRRRKICIDECQAARTGRRNKMTRDEDDLWWKIYPCCWSSTNADFPGLPVAPSMPYFGV